MKTFFNQKALLYALSLTVITSSSTASIFAQDSNTKTDHKEVSISADELVVKNNKDYTSYTWVNKKSSDELATKTPKLGVILNGHESGVVIKKAFPNTAAAEIGLQENDKVIMVDGKTTDNVIELRQIIQSHKVGDAIVVKYERDGVTKTGAAILRAASEGQYTNSHKRYSYTYNYNQSYSTENLKENPCEKLEKIYGKPFLGVYLSNPHAENGSGAKLTSIIKGTGAEAAILKAADKITKMDQTPISSTKEAIKFIQSKKPGDQIQIQVVRENKTMLIRATLGSWADNPNSTKKISLLEEYCDASTPTEEIPVVEEEEETEEEIPTSEEETVATTLPSFETEAIMEVFPNPTADFVTIRYEGKKAPLAINIVSLDGKAVYNKVIQNFDGYYNDQLDLSKYPSGVYLINLTQDDQQITQQVVVE